jgi:hypothetical protein
MKAILLIDPSGKTLIDPSKDCAIHEIDIPDDAETLYVGVNGLKFDSCRTITDHISIPHPKKKVKKWRWLLVRQFGGQSVYAISALFSVNRSVEDVARSLKIGWRPVRTIPETAVEVEE